MDRKKIKAVQQILKVPQFEPEEFAIDPPHQWAAQLLEVSLAGLLPHQHVELIKAAGGRVPAKGKDSTLASLMVESERALSNLFGIHKSKEDIHATKYLLKDPEAVKSEVGVKTKHRSTKMADIKDTTAKRRTGGFKKKTSKKKAETKKKTSKKKAETKKKTSKKKAASKKTTAKKAGALSPIGGAKNWNAFDKLSKLKVDKEAAVREGSEKEQLKTSLVKKFGGRAFSSAQLVKHLETAHKLSEKAARSKAYMLVNQHVAVK